MCDSGDVGENDGDIQSWSSQEHAMDSRRNRTNLIYFVSCTYLLLEWWTGHNFQNNQRDNKFRSVRFSTSTSTRAPWWGTSTGRRTRVSRFRSSLMWDLNMWQMNNWDNDTIELLILTGSLGFMEEYVIDYAEIVQLFLKCWNSTWIGSSNVETFLFDSVLSRNRR